MEIELETLAEAMRAKKDYEKKEGIFDENKYSRE